MYRKNSIWILIFLLISVQNYGQSKIKLLHTLFDSLNTARQFNGVVLVADSGKVIFEQSYGYADFGDKIPMTVDTRFEIASVSKQFTAMAVMQLYNEGKLRYEDPARKYLPGLPYKNVTISELIHHGSGIPDFLGWTEKQMGHIKGPYTNEQIESHLQQLAPETTFEPGTQFSYSNTNYLLLANIVSKIAGVPFAEYMDQHIFKKAGMANTTIPVEVNKTENGNGLARDYLWDPVTGKYRLFSQASSADYAHFIGGLSGPAGIKTTARDLFKWTQAVNSHVLVPDSIFSTAVLRPQLMKNGKDTFGYSNMAYTFGWLLVKRKEQKGTFIFHNGGFGGYRSIIAYYPYINRTIVVLENTDQTVSPDNLLAPIGLIMNGVKRVRWPVIRGPRKTIPVDSSYLEALTGTYTMRPNAAVKMVITAKNGRLYAKYIDQATAELYPYAKDQFFFLIADAQIKFVPNSDKYNELILIQNGRELHFFRDL